MTYVNYVIMLFVLLRSIIRLLLLSKSEFQVLKRVNFQPNSIAVSRAPSRMIWRETISDAK